MTRKETAPAQPPSADEFRHELQNILDYWMTYTIDEKNGGFYGSISNNNKVNEDAPKGSVLNARILWSFSAAYNLTKDDIYLPVAERSAAYILDHFIDQEYGGVFWSVSSKGEPLETKKQIYALAFTIYGLTEFYAATKNEKALDMAKQLYHDIEMHSYDHSKGGYIEAFTREWNGIDDLRLSAKDGNEKKTMNTHLHILEAYTNLYCVWPDAGLASRIEDLIDVFKKYIIHAETGHLNLFFDEDWTVKSDTVSYGHDIEAAWLLLEAAEVLGNEELIKKVKNDAVTIAVASAEGLGPDGSLYYEAEPLHHQLITDKHWWVQAEAVVGFFNAWQLTGEQQFLDKSAAAWNFIQRHIIDHTRGEWFWGVTETDVVMQGFDKAGFWKCPYHNSRACIEMIKRLATQPA